MYTYTHTTPNTHTHRHTSFSPLVLESESLSHDTWCGVSCDLEEVSCDLEEVSCDLEEVSCDLEEVLAGQVLQWCCTETLEVRAKRVSS